jgi:hypothetical protein
MRKNYQNRNRYLRMMIQLIIPGMTVIVTLNTMAQEDSTSGYELGGIGCGKGESLHMEISTLLSIFSAKLATLTGFGILFLAILVFVERH